MITAVRTAGLQRSPQLAFRTSAVMGSGARAARAPASTMERHLRFPRGCRRARPRPDDRHALAGRAPFPLDGPLGSDRAPAGAGAQFGARRAPARPLRSSAPRGPGPMAKESPFDPDLVRELANLIAETDLTEIEVEKGDLRIRVARTVTAPVTRAGRPRPARRARRGGAAARRRRGAVGAEAAAIHPGAVLSPMVGTAYRKPSPDAKTFVEIGSQGRGRRQGAPRRGDEDLQRHRRAARRHRHGDLRRGRHAGRVRRAAPRDRVARRCSTRS